MDGENQGTTPAANAGTQNNNGTVTQPVATQNKTEGTVTQPVNKTEGNEGTKTFTQEEVNAMLMKERKKLPDAEEMKAFKEWQENQKTAEQKQQEAMQEAQRIKAENEQKNQMLEIMKKGVDYETAEFIQFKLSKKDGDFNENLEAYFKDNPVGDKENKKPGTTGINQNNASGTGTDANKDYLDKKYANNPYYKK